MHLNSTCNENKSKESIFVEQREEREVPTKSYGRGNGIFPLPPHKTKHRKTSSTRTFTAVDLRRSIMCAAWPDNICLESTSLPPKLGFQEVLLISITIFISSYLHFFFLQIQVFRRSLSLSIKIIYNQVLRDKMFWSANFPRLPRQFTYILNNFRLSK